MSRKTSDCRDRVSDARVTSLTRPSATPGGMPQLDGLDHGQVAQVHHDVVGQLQRGAGTERAGVHEAPERRLDDRAQPLDDLGVAPAEHGHGVRADALDPPAGERGVDQVDPDLGRGRRQLDHDVGRHGGHDGDGGAGRRGA